jgi:hypothetical protein
MDGSGEDIGVRNRDAKAVGPSCSNVFNNAEEQRMSETALVGICTYTVLPTILALSPGFRHVAGGRQVLGEPMVRRGRISRKGTTSSHRRRPVIPPAGSPVTSHGGRRELPYRPRFAHAFAAATRAHHTVEQGPSAGSPSGAHPAVWAQRRPPAAAGEIPASRNQVRVLATTTCGRSSDILAR